LEARLIEILAAPELVRQIMELYIPTVLREKLGETSIMALLNEEKLQPYRDAIITKKMASMAFYRFGEEWQAYLQELEEELIPALQKVFAS
jgi:glutamate dehydrogenase